jgi:hypothetical protein
MPPDHRLGEERACPIQFEVRVVGGVVHESIGDEEPGGVDQQGGVRVLVSQLLADPVHLRAVRQVGGDAVR